MSTTNTAPKITVSALRDMISSLVLRRVYRSPNDGFVRPQDQIDHILYFVSDEKQPVKISPTTNPNDYIEMIEGKNSTWISNHLEFHSKNWRLSTNKFSSFKNDKFNNEPIQIRSECCFAFDTIRFQFTDNTGTTLVPHTNTWICGIPARDPKYNTLYYKQWFACSEQFVKLWVGIMYGDDCDFFNKLIDREKRNTRLTPREFLFRKNNLCMSNSIAKEDAARSHNNFPLLTTEEKEARYSRSQTEPDSRDPSCVHKYAAMFTMLVYNEALTPYNFPVNHVNARVCKWIIPETLVEDMNKVYELNLVTPPIPEKTEDEKAYVVLCRRVHIVLNADPDISLEEAFKRAHFEYKDGELENLKDYDLIAEIYGDKNKKKKKKVIREKTEIANMLNNPQN